MNFMKTYLLLFILTFLFMAIGFFVGGSNGAIIAFFLAAGINFFAYWNSDKMVLKMTKAQVADPQSYKAFYDIVRHQTQVANLPMPALYVINEDQPNAFATGRNPEHAAVAVTTGLWNLLSREEVAGVIAHELAHIKNRDILIGTIAATFAGAISMIANMLMFMNLFSSNSENRPHPVVSIAVMLIAPIVSGIIQMSISRQREYAADKLGGSICGNPLHLASALNKLENYAKDMKSGAATPATAHMYIINPFKEKSDNLFSTHPNSKNRIAALTSQAQDMGIIGFKVEEPFYNQNYNQRYNQNNRQNYGMGATANTNVEVKAQPEYRDKNVRNNPWL